MKLFGHLISNASSFELAFDASQRSGDGMDEKEISIWSSCHGAICNVEYSRDGLKTVPSVSENSLEIFNKMRSKPPKLSSL